MIKNISVVAFATLSAMAQASDFADYAPVLSAYPVTERFETPHTECREPAPVESAGERKLGGAIIGAVVGGLLGAQVGKGHGNTAGAAVGAATGAIVGDRTQNRQGAGSPIAPGSECRTVYRTVTREIGYDVTYDFHGRRITERLARDPGSQLRVDVSVRAAK